ncbi:acetate--CoA ligase family protein [Candidatus Woesearchaeota archaeon]|nr:acetate--CoA ligase family protein [Candidatus Woesearchaeota archaeon]
MNITEHNAKEILKKEGVAVPRGVVIDRPEQIVKAIHQVPGLHAVLKAQIHGGHRKKSGAILISNKSRAQADAKRLLGMNVKGEKIRELLVEQKLDIEKEHYLAITLDGSSEEIVIMYSPWGGVDIEEVAAWDPRKITNVRFTIPPADGKRENKYAGNEIKKVNLAQLKKELKENKIPIEISNLCATLMELLYKHDALLIEINPLAETKRGFVAADAKMIIDDNALYRQPALEPFADENLSPLEAKARKDHVQYVDLDGDIAVIGNGAGLVMATLDMIDAFGGKAANFLDVGGSGAALEAQKALSIVLSKPNVHGLFINIFGGITHCDKIAEGLIAYRHKHKLKIPMVVRMIGTREKEAKALLKKNGVQVFAEMEAAAKQIVTLVHRQKGREKRK